MNDAEIMAILISLFTFLICTPIIAYCCCVNKSGNQYQILLSTNDNDNENFSMA